MQTYDSLSASRKHLVTRAQWPHARRRVTSTLCLCYMIYLVFKRSHHCDTWAAWNAPHTYSHKHQCAHYYFPLWISAPPPLAVEQIGLWTEPCIWKVQHITKPRHRDGNLNCCRIIVQNLCTQTFKKWTNHRGGERQTQTVVSERQRRRGTTETPDLEGNKVKMTTTEGLFTETLGEGTTSI